MLGRRRRHRSREVTEEPRWSTARVRPRVLVEHADGAVGDHLVAGLRQRGYDALGCEGPDEQTPCPLLQGRPCAAVEQADAVVTGLVDEATGRAIATAIHSSHPDRPLLMEGTPLMLRDLEAEMPISPVFPLEVDRVADLLDQRLARR